MNSVSALDSRPGHREIRLIHISGCVQGVGFRPHLYRLAHKYGVNGWARNSHSGVELLVHSDTATIELFLKLLTETAPAIAVPKIEFNRLVDTSEISTIEPGFRIIKSRIDDQGGRHLPLDLDCCSNCLGELFDPRNRRYRDPFINCTQCGPRYTSFTVPPYDRDNTSMADFPRCDQCEREYNDPFNRRFHAETICCPECGPQLSWSEGRVRLDNSTDALRKTDEALRAGKIVAVKGIGGYHLLCAADSDEPVARLRERKGRPDKPLAVMFPQRGSDGLDALRHELRLDVTETELLTARSRPVVLCHKRDVTTLSSLIAPGTNRIGALLPYTPLHQLILHDFGRPVVATSANISGEPVMTDADEVETRLSNVADAFLHHNRKIIHTADDSLFQVVNRQPRPLRLGRGHTPKELSLPFRLPQPLLAVGGEMKNTIALGWDSRIVISPHIGELASPRSAELFKETIAELQQQYNVTASHIVCDAHPNYFSHRWARTADLPVTRIYHHRAHAAAIAGEYNIDGSCLVFTWDGSGYGEDGTLWGGEALLGTPGNWRRVATLRPFGLPGGERAVREPWRCAAALSWEADEEWNGHPQAALLHQAWRKRINTPLTSSVGRLFDGAAALLGLTEQASYEGHAAMLLQAAAETAQISGAEALPHTFNDGVMLSDWAPLVRIVNDNRKSIADRAAWVHSALAHTLCDQAVALRENHGEFVVGLNGGAFQNRLLTEQAVALLEQQGFAVYLPQQLPSNDAALCFGQIVEAAARLQ